MGIYPIFLKQVKGIGKEFKKRNYLKIKELL
jgi:hypothetical protein